MQSNDITMVTDEDDDEVVIRQKPANHRPRGRSAYMTLLSSLANDLDEMLNDLHTTTAQRVITQQRTSISIVTHMRSEQLHIKSKRLTQQHASEPVDVDDEDDDLQALLPHNRILSREDLTLSRTSLVSSSDGGILAEGEDTSSESGVSADSTGPACDLGLVERLLRTHPVWCLPGIQRAGAVHLLQGRDQGNFIVRGSSQTNTMAVSVRLPNGVGPYIEHYLVQSNDGILSLESSRFKFDSLPALIAHYAQCCDELPVQLTLPRALREAKNRQVLSSLTLLGQEFWRHPLSTPKVNNTSSPPLPSSHTIKSPSDTTSGIGTVSVSNSNSQISNNPSQQSQQIQNKIVNYFGVTNGSNQVETPESTSSLSSFTISNNCQQILSPESVDKIVLTPIPIDNCSNTGIIGKTSTFKIQGQQHQQQNQHQQQIQNQTKNQITTSLNYNNNNEVDKHTHSFNANLLGLNNNNNINNNNNNNTSVTLNNISNKINTLSTNPNNNNNNVINNNLNNNNNNNSSNNNNIQMVGPIRAPRPTPPNTLNLGPLRTPPIPPPRWIEPLTPKSPNVDALQTNNFTVTTTVTFSVDGQQNSPSQNVEITTPTASNTTVFPTISKRLSPDGESKMQDMSSTHSSVRIQSQSSKDSLRMIASPTLTEIPITRTRRSKRKESKHYQESDILESPSVYCRSTLCDKISDYEDLWTQDAINSPLGRGGNMSSFRPQAKRPDIVLESPTITSLNNNLLSPAGSITSSNPSPLIFTSKTQINNLSINSVDSFNNNYNNHNNNHNNNNNYITDNNYNSNNSSNNSNNHIEDIIKLDDSMKSPMDTNKNIIRNLQTFSPIPSAIQSPSPLAEHITNQMLQPRNRLGLILPTSNESIESPKTPVPLLYNNNNNNSNSNSKPGSPFYAEPADALYNIKRRNQQRTIPLPHNQRFSEPPKGPARPPPSQILLPGDDIKNNFAGSLDELKRKHRKARGRLDPWPLDSSWEFLGNDDEQPHPSQSQSQQQPPNLQHHHQAQQQQQQQQHPNNNNNNSNDNDYDSDIQWRNQYPKQKAKMIEHVAQMSGAGGSTTNINNKHLDILLCKPLTIHQIIAKRLPDLNVSDLVKLPNTSIAESESYNGPSIGTFKKNNRLSAYDNVDKYNSGYASSLINSAQSDDGTVFSEPWDSSQWDSFFPPEVICHSEDDTIMEEDRDSSSNTLKNNSGQNGNGGASRKDDIYKSTSSSSIGNQQKVATILRSRSCRDREILCHPRNKISLCGPGETVGAYALSLASDKSSTFARNIDNFISCTKESREVAPQVVMRNMRQFMSGMKNYLVKHGEGDFGREVERARSRLKSDEFLNLDTILERVMHRLVILPLREHLCGLFVDYYSRSGDIQLLVENVKYAYSREPADFGIRSSVTPPTTGALRQISSILLRLQEAELPLEKLDLLLAAVSTIFDATGCPRGQQLSADDFLPLLVFVVSRCGFISAEIEAEYMWGLLQPSLLSGEAGYYLTALCSAVHVLKSFMSSDNEGTGSIDWRSSSLPACSSVLRVIIPDEFNGSIQTRTLPVRPHTTTKEVCRIIAHKARITNPQDYALFKLVDGEETLLLDTECPQDARIAARGKHCLLAYKRIEAKIAWPTTSPSNY